MTAFELAAKIKLDSSEFNSSLKKQESAFQKFGTKLSNAAKKTAKLAAAGMATVAAGSVMFMKKSVQEGLNFDKAMAQVAATMGKSVDEVKELRDFARQMGQNTAFSATEAAQALNYMALAGYDADKSMRMLPQVLNLAAAGNIDLARASDMVTDAQSALGLSIEETEDLVNQMARASSISNTSVAQLGDAILTVGGTAKSLKGGTTELSALLGVLADNGIKGAEGGTALRNVLLSLSAPTGEAAEEMKRLGINAFDADGNMRDFPAILQDINNATKDMTQEQRTNFLSEVFNKRDLKAIEAMLGTDMQRWAELMTEIQYSGEAAEEMAKTQLDNLAGDLTILKSALSEARITISDKLTPSLRKFAQKGIEWVNRLTNAFKAGGFKGALKEVGVLFRESVTDWLNIGKDASWGEIGKAAATKIKNGFLGVGVSIKKLLLGDSYTDGATWTDVANHLKEALNGAFKEGGLLDTMLGNAGEKTAAMLSLAGEFVKGIANWIATNTGDIVGIITSIATAIGEATAPIVEALVSVVTDPALWDAVRNMLEKVVRGIIGDDAFDRFFGQQDVRRGRNLYQEYAEAATYKTLTDEEGIPYIQNVGAMYEQNKSKFGELYADAYEMLFNQTKKAMDEATAEYNAGNITESELESKHNALFAAFDALIADLQKDTGKIQQPAQSAAVDITSLGSAAESAAQELNSISVPDPFGVFHQAKGNWYVPYDNYPSLLHRGERVLTASQARHGEGGKVDYIRIGEMIGMAVDSAISRMGVYLGADRVGDLTSQRVGKNIRVNSNARLRAMGG